MNHTTNIASGNIDKLKNNAIRCAREALAANNKKNPICTTIPPGPLIVQVPSMLLLARQCPPVTPGNVTVPSSVYMESKIANYNNCNNSGPEQRFSHYERWQPPPPCQPLPQSANTAGISKASTKGCNSFSY